MRYPITAVILCLLATAAAGDERSDDFEVVLSVSHTRMKDMQYLMCGRFDGCTHFVAPTLTAGCSARDGVWSMRPQARLHALAYVFDVSLVSHEQLHVQDMQQSVRMHLRALETAAFSSEGECGRAASQASLGFRDAVTRFAAQSMAVRH